MTRKQLQEVIYNFYYGGRPKASSQTLSKPDFAQMVKMNAGSIMRQLYYTNRAMKTGNEYYFYCGMLDVKRFPLSEADQRGKRRIDMSAFDIYRLPKNNHITNIFPIGSCSGEGDGTMEITLVANGEENFYAGNSDFAFFKFGVLRGKGMDTYNIPGCIGFLDVETTYDSDDVDIPLDVCFDIANQTLGLSLKLKGFPIKVLDNPYDPNAVELRKRLADTQET